MRTLGSIEVVENIKSNSVIRVINNFILIISVSFNLIKIIFGIKGIVSGITS